MGFHPDEQDRPRRKGYVNSLEFVVGALVTLIGVVLAYSLALRLVG